MQLIPIDLIPLGGWEWNFLWKRYPLPKRESDKLSEKTMPYPSPAMAGGLFAINREYFNSLGMYDPGLEIWGGENYEISYKVSFLLFSSKISARTNSKTDFLFLFQFVLVTIITQKFP